MRPSIRPPAAAAAVLAVHLWAAGLQAQAQPPGTPGREPGGRAVASLEIGGPAPEFALRPLPPADGGTPPEPATVRLSDFRGKVPVCLFFASYT